MKRSMPWRSMLYTFLECWGVCVLSFWVPTILLGVSESHFELNDLFFNMQYHLLLGTVMALLLLIAMILINVWNGMVRKYDASYAVLYGLWVLLLIGAFVAYLNTEMFKSEMDGVKVALGFMVIVYSCVILPIVLGLCFIFFKKNKLFLK